VKLDADAFEALVSDELDLLPEEMVTQLDNVIFVVEDRAADGSLDTLGLYDGWALTDRDRYGFGEVPDESSCIAKHCWPSSKMKENCATRFTSHSSTKSVTTTGWMTHNSTNWDGRRQSIG